MEIKSCEYWLRVILIDFRKPENMDQGERFFSEYAKKYVLPLEAQRVTSKYKNVSKERFFVKIGSVRNVFERITCNFIFSTYTSEWNEIKNLECNESDQ